MSNTTDAPARQVALPTASDLLGLTSRPVDTIAHPAWTEAREAVLALLAAGPAMILLLGPPGTGKTAMLRDLATTLGECGRTVRLLAFGDSPVDVGPAEIVLVDEADRISTARLDELRSRGDLAIILAAVPASLEQFAPYADAAVVRLAPLSPDEACAFLAERLAQLGLPNGALTEAAWSRLISHGHGVPRLLLALLGFALFVAAEEHADRVTDAHVKEAVEARGGSTDPAAAEPRVEARPAQRSIPENGSGTVKAARAETDLTGSIPGTALELTGAAPPPSPPSPRRNRVIATAFAAACLVAATILLTWDHRQMPETAAPGPDASAATLAAADGLAQMASGSHPLSDAPASESTAAQPDPDSPADGASSEEEAATASPPDTVPVATTPFGANVPPAASAPDLPHRCSDGNWTWSTCPTPSRHVMWRRVRRCVAVLGNACLGASYDYVRAK